MTHWTYQQYKGYTFVNKNDGSGWQRLDAEMPTGLNHSCHDAINLPTDIKIYDEDGITLASYTDHPPAPWIEHCSAGSAAASQPNVRTELCRVTIVAMHADGMIPEHSIPAEARRILEARGLARSAGVAGYLELTPRGMGTDPSVFTV